MNRIFSLKENAASEYETVKLKVVKHKYMKIINYYCYFYHCSDSNILHYHHSVSHLMSQGTKMAVMEWSHGYQWEWTKDGQDPGPTIPSVLLVKCSARLTGQSLLLVEPAKKAHVSLACCLASNQPQIWHDICVPTLSHDH